jgi:DNA replication protein DnaC
MRNLKDRVKGLGLNAMLANWHVYENAEWLPQLVEEEERERDRRSFERRTREARIGQFKTMAEFDWTWPEEVDREQIEDLFSLSFMDEKSNVVLVGNNGLGKSMIAQNLANTAMLRGITTRFVKASEMLTDLAESESSFARKRRMKKYCNVGLLVIDEVGYMNYDTRFADLLYEVISYRYQKAATVVTTNKAFRDWGEIFPHAACVVTLVDRLTHKSEMVVLKGESYRHKEAEEHAALKAKERKQRKGAKKSISSAS